MIVYANFHSDLAVHLAAHEVLDRWAEHASREIWLTRPGDVLVTPVPLSLAFRRYAGELTATPHESVTVLNVPPVAGAPFAEAVHRTGLMGTLRSLAATRPGIQLLPIALDVSTAGLAAQLGVPVAPYGPRGITPGALSIAYHLNTKAAFRALAADLGIRIPAGRCCDGTELEGVVSAMLTRHKRVVVKPNRSAGGYQLHFVTRTEPWSAPGPLSGEWVVEEHLDAARSLSVQMDVRKTGPRVVFCGEMHTAGGAYDGYFSPVEKSTDATTKELTRWASALGSHLAGHGYAGSCGIDAVLDPRSRLFATESNVRRTATTAPHALVDRLSRAAGLREPAWLLATGRSRAPHTFTAVAELLREAGLAWTPSRAEGVVLYRDTASDGQAWPYAVIAAGHRRVRELQAQLGDVMQFDAPS
ncbi:peptide ligase PGM1-related protein [Streptomyces sp. Ag109_G2-15]|uniref:preATP grasp domain-containing protein n=1 Tax=Streptomyces sp. Ag109_G2-15 TaxID=1938850 RepID=UPI00117FA42E|nr:peptide ligase PGM1-related protein [Streptomyces sp. Ag109_G2-15]